MPSPDWKGTPPGQLLAVYEAANPELKEVYVGATGHLLERLKDAFLNQPPAIVSHWRPRAPLVFRFIEYAVPAKAVHAFIEVHAAKAAKGGWTVLLDP